MSHAFRRIMCLLAVMLLCVSSFAYAEGNISTTVVMRVSKMTQQAIVNAGEELSMQVNIDGVEPDSYQWYFNDAPVEGADQNVYNIINARPEDAGIYRLDAFDADGRMLVSMDIAARVIDGDIPQTGDTSMPVGFAFAGMAVCAGLMVALLRRRHAA